jgi:Flp pilus assembly protein CpaB
MKPKTLVLMVVAVGCGLAASYMTSRLIQERKDQPSEAKVKVLVAKLKVSPWVPIKEPEKFFVEKEVPESVAPRKALKSLAEVKDQKLCKVVNEESIVTTDDLLNKDQASLAHLMKPGQRAIALKVSAETLDGNRVRPGDRVDVVSTLRGGETRTILQGVMVLAVSTPNTRSVRDPEPGADFTRWATAGEVVTLAATPEESQQLALAASMGDLRLVLPPVGGATKLPLRPAKVGDLGKPVPDRADDDGKDDDRQAQLPAKLPAVPETKPEPKVEAPEPPRETHKMTIRTGEIDLTAVFVKDDEGSWKAGRITQTTDDLDATPRRPAPQPAPQQGPQQEPQQAPAPAVQQAPAPAVSAAPDTRGAGRNSRIK